jgi:hypothetical protein
VRACVNQSESQKEKALSEKDLRISGDNSDSFGYPFSKLQNASDLNNYENKEDEQFENQRSPRVRYCFAALLSIIVISILGDFVLFCLFGFFFCHL